MRRGSNKGTQCTACDQDCHVRFVCRECGWELNVCRYLVGGFESFEAGRLVCSGCLDGFATTGRKMVKKVSSHGTAGYRQGCRCVVCAGSARDRWREYKLRRAVG